MQETKLKTGFFFLSILLFTTSVATAQYQQQWYVADYLFGATSEQQTYQHINFNTEPPAVAEKDLTGVLPLKQMPIGPVRPANHPIPINTITNVKGKKQFATSLAQLLNPSLKPIDTMYHYPLSQTKTLYNAHRNTVISYQGNDTLFTLILPYPDSSFSYHTFDTIALFRYKNLSLSQSHTAPRLGKTDSSNEMANFYTQRVYPATVLSTPHQKAKWYITHMNQHNSLSAHLFENGNLKKDIQNKINFPKTRKHWHHKWALYPSLDGKLIIFIFKNKLYKIPFNPQSGKFQPKQILDSIPSLHDITAFSQRVEFSPNDSFIYLSYIPTTTITTKNPPIPKGILQYERYADSIAASKTLIKSNTYYGDMQLGPNGKIYLKTTGNRVDVINHPNRKGEKAKLTKNFIKGQRPLDLRERSSSNRWIMPMVFPSTDYNTNDFVSFRHRYHCKGTHFIETADSNFTDFQWYVENLKTNNIDTLDGQKAYYPIQHAGQHYVRLKGRTEKGYEAWYSDTMYLDPPPLPKADFSIKGPDKRCETVEYQLKGQAFADTIHPIKGHGYEWHINDQVIKGPKQYKHRFTEAGQKQIRFLYSNGFCTDTASKEINVLPLEADHCSEFQSYLHVPNAFSPNGDGTNDVFSIGGQHINQLHIRIFNRWGQKVFESKDSEFEWKGSFKGRKLKADTYFYILEAEGKKQQQFYRSGEIKLLGG